MTIAAFDKQNLKTLRADLDAALKAVADKHGIDLSVGTIRFDAAAFSAKIDGAVKQKAADGSVVEGDLPASHKWVVGWNRYAESYGFKVTDLGREFSLYGKRYRVAGLTIHGKDALVAKPLDRKTDKFMLLPADAVKAALAA